jgi:hypothetical protein
MGKFNNASFGHTTYKMDKQDKPKEVDGIDELKGIFE